MPRYRSRIPAPLIQSAAAGIPTIGMRTSLSHDDLVAAGAGAVAVASAGAYDDDALMRLVAAAMRW
jgi:hypothetical protein